MDQGPDPTGGRVITECTGTLVGKRTVLTAAHCLFDGKPHIFKVGGKTYTPSKGAQHPSYDANDKENYPNDIGVLILSAEPGIAPSLISRGAPNQGDKITVVGFGATKDDVMDVGTKRLAVNFIAKVIGTRFDTYGTGNGTGAPCKGDSGGPAFTTPGGQEIVSGVVSAGRGACGTEARYTRVDAYVSWLEQISGGDLATVDKQAPQVSITSPAAGASVAARFMLTATATDNVKVTSVVLKADGKSVSERLAEPYHFDVELTEGSHTLRVEAWDSVGNVGHAEISVTVGGGPPAAAFGESCREPADCQSRLCAQDATGQQYCTQECAPEQNSCPSEVACVAAAGKNVCAPPSSKKTEPDMSGSCATASSSGRPSERVGGPMLFLVAVALALAGRRARRRHS
ncbi:MAG: trypsin-like serine protease [Deltaproteobacteria bacterium]|nr:trypsin-like serine protease [Deltaproteobacteria bacterium]